jgi:Ca-activated chloride channel homolog
MSFPGFFSLASAWLFLLVVPLVVFYFLKLKRPRLEIPSLALWRQVINDRRVNSPFQKFKRNLLLWLQLLMLILVILAAMQPFLHSGADRAEHLPVLVDCSASMAALDKPGGETRLAAAKREVGQLIDNLLPDQKVSLITFDGTARQVADFTDNKRMLRDALDKIAVSDVPSNLEDALRMTHALSRAVPIHTVVIYSDGNFPEQVDFELPFQLNYQQLPPAGPNIGITDFNARRSQTARWDVFVRVAGSEAASTGAAIELLQDGRVIGEDTVILEAGDSQRLIFRVDTDSATALEVRLKPDSFDSLASDNVAWLDLPVARPLMVYVSPELASYRHAVRGLKGLVLYPDEAGETSTAGYDLAITDQQSGADLDAVVTLSVGVIPRDLQGLISMTTGAAQIVDWQRNDALLQHVQLMEVQIADEPQLSDGINEGAFEELGYAVLAHSRTGPLILRKSTGEKLSYYLLFHSDRSTLPYRVGFPILVSNIVQTALQQASLAEVRGRPTRVLPPQSLAPERAYRVVGPNGFTRDVKSNAEGVVDGVPAPHVGRYVFRDGGQEAAAVGVSLLSPQETSLASVAEIQFREMSVTAAEATLKSDRPLWPLLAFMAFGMLLVEWWYYQRRPGGAAG